jgi:hypothetical protein
MKTENMEITTHWEGNTHKLLLKYAPPEEVGSIKCEINGKEIYDQSFHKNEFETLFHWLCNALGKTGHYD